MCWLVDSVNRFTTWSVCSNCSTNLSCSRSRQVWLRPGELAVQRGQLADHLVVELLEPGGEPA